MPPEIKPIRKSLHIHQDKTLYESHDSLFARLCWKCQFIILPPGVSYHTGISAIYPQRRLTNQISFNKNNNVAYCNGQNNFQTRN